MGIVYKARDLKLGRIVALKFLPPEWNLDGTTVKRFIHEAKAASSLDHKNICTIYEIDETEKGQLFISMACYEGETLRQKLSRNTLTLEETIDIAIQIAEGLSEAHSKDIIHRDINPSNIMITTKGEVKILDFGLAKLADSSKITRSGTTLGTAHYMSPEQANSEEVDPRTDIWSLGVVIYEMITGQTPFQGKYEAAVLYSIVYKKPAFNKFFRENVPDELKQIIIKSLMKPRDKRYTTAQELLAKLKSVTLEGPLSGKRQKLLRDQKWKTAGTIALILALLAATGILLKQNTSLRKKLGLLKHSLTVFIFEDKSREEEENGWGKEFTRLLISGLSQSERLSVTSYQHLYDVLTEQTLKDETGLSDSTRKEIARLTGADKYIIGQISGADTQLVLTADMVDVSSGRSVTTLSLFGGDLYSLADTLVGRVLDFLGIFSEDQRKNFSPVAVQTTSNPTALRHFSEGEENLFRYYFQDAISAFKRAVALDSSFSLAYSRLATVYDFLKQSDNFKNAIQLSLKYSSRLNRQEKYYVLAMNSLLENDLNKTKSFLMDWVEYFPQDKYGHYHLAQFYDTYTLLYDEAIIQYLEAIRLDPHFKLAYNYLGYAYAYRGYRGDKDKAISALNDYQRNAEGEVNPWDSKGEVYMNLMGDYENAEKAFLKVYEIKPDFAPHKLAEVYQLRGQYSKAESYLSKMFQMDMPLMEGQKWFYLARFHFEKEDFQTALEQVNRAKDLLPDFSPSYWLRGLVNLKLDRLENAQEDYIQLRRLDSLSALSDHLSGHIFLFQKQYDHAVESFRRASQKVRGMALSHFEHAEFYRQELSYAYAQKGDLDQAIDLCRLIIVDNPNWATAYYDLGQYYERKGLSSQALNEYKNFRQVWSLADQDNPKMIFAAKHIEQLEKKY